MYFSVTATMINYPYLTLAVVIESYAAQVEEAIRGGRLEAPPMAIAGPEGRAGALKDGSRGTHLRDQFRKELKRSICWLRTSGVFSAGCLRPAWKGTVRLQHNALSINHSTGRFYTK